MMPDSGLRAMYYDGRLARPHDVCVELADGRVRVVGEGVMRDEPRESVLITEPVGSATRFLYFHDGAYGEVSEPQALRELLATDGVRHRLHDLERSPWKAVACLVALALTITVAYVYGLPWLATVIAERLPDSTLDIVSAQVLQSLDRTLLHPSDYTAFRRNELLTAFHRLQLPPSTAGRVHPVFRKSEALGANALALPSGVVIVTDGLVDLVRNDEEFVAVLAHEAGHIERRHGLRGIIQGSVVSGMVTWYIGDVSALAAAAPAALLNARYSRALEREADDFAAERLRASGMRSSALADILERLEQSQGVSRRGSAAFAYLSSHPTTAERLARLRGKEH